MDSVPFTLKAWTSCDMQSPCMSGWDFSTWAPLSVEAAISGALFGWRCRWLESTVFEASPFVFLQPLSVKATNSVWIVCSKVLLPPSNCVSTAIVLFVIPLPSTWPHRIFSSHRLKLERSTCALCVGRLQQRLYRARRTSAPAILRDMLVAHWSVALWK